MDIADSSSDGEITNDLSDISEDEYFDNLASMIEKRKLELELMNEIEGKNYDDYPKENRYINNRPNVSSMRRRNNSGSNNITNNNVKDKSRNRSYRASSVFSSYSMPAKRRKNERQNRKRRKYSKLQQQQKKQQPVATQFTTLSSDENDEDDTQISIKLVNNKHQDVDEEESDEEDEELLALRLQALTSKQEVKELIEPETIEIAPPAVEAQPPSSPVTTIKFISPNEEELLRIAALRSAVFKKKDHIKARKKLMKLENDRPYSPTDIFEPISFDDAMELSNSPLGSPFNNVFEDEINQEEVDMDISNSYPATPEHETSDMELALSPEPKPPGEEVEEQQREELTQFEDDNEEEDLRSKLLISMSEKKKDQTNITKNLKMAVERLKQKHIPPPIVTVHKSGTKTIKMLLEEKTRKVSQQKPIITTNLEAANEVIQKVAENGPPEVQEVVTEEQQSETVLLGKITNSGEQETYSKPPSPSASENIIETSFSTITDTKNIPLLPQVIEITKSKDKRLITSLDSVIKPVLPLIITLNNESSEDEYSRSNKRTVRRVVRTQKGPNEFEQNLDSFLKNIRMSQEQKRVQFAKATTSSLTKVNNNNQSKVESTVKKIQSAVKHLPLSSQMEYENLLKKMEILQKEKKQRHQLRQLKRTKSSSSSLPAVAVSSDQNKSTITTNAINQETKSKQQVETKSEEKKVDKGANKIDDTLSKISLLDAAARHRLIEKTENNFRNHSKNLMDSTEQSLKMLEESSLQIRQRKIVETKIQELEKSLTKYKSFLKVVNSRIKTNIPKVIQTQRDMIKFRNHQHKFKDICKRVGENVRGDEYRLPDHQSTEITQNFLKISTKTDELHHAFKEQYASKQLKLLADKVKTFIPESETVEESSSKENSEELKVDSSIPETKEEKEASDSCVIESSDNQVTNETLDTVKDSTEKKEEETIPETQTSTKRVLEKSHLTCDASKRLKVYNSPLEYLKDNSRSKSVNDVICPYALEGSCTDNNCKMVHL